MCQVNPLIKVAASIRVLMDPWMPIDGHRNIDRLTACCYYVYLSSTIVC